MSHFLFSMLMLCSLFQMGWQGQATLSNKISNVKILTPVLAAFDPFKANFDLQTTANDPYLPYDTNPPKGLEHISGVSVDALFTSPSGLTFSQPAFLNQPVDIRDVEGQDHILPHGSPNWEVRFTPQEQGQWEFRLRATDSNGMTLFPHSIPLTFQVNGISSNPYRQHGFLRVSPKDKRYFEFQDGTPYVGLGFNSGFGSLTQTETRLVDYEKNRVNLVRTWLSGDGINGSQWTPWASFHLSSDGYLPPVSLETKDVYPGHDTANKLDDNNPCLFQGWQGGRIPVEPDTTYTIWARVKVNNVSSAGFVMKLGGWLGKKCGQVEQGTALTQPLTGTSGWTEITGTIRTGPGDDWLDRFLFLARQGEGGTALVDEVRLFRSDDPAKVNILRHPSADAHLSFDPIASARWDQLIQDAETHGVYLKLVIDEKNEWIRNHINQDGHFVEKGDNNNFYAAAGTKVRWLEQAWWRYIIARWGYSTAIHSFEYINEGDPYNGNHYDAAEAMGRYFHQHDPSRPLVTTSFWASFPNKEFWSNPKYADMDYADLHAYITTGWPDARTTFLKGYPLVTDRNDRHGDAAGSVVIDQSTTGQVPITPRGIVLREKGEWILSYWMKTANFHANCPLGSSGGLQHIRWVIDGGVDSGGNQAIVPTNAKGQDNGCTTPARTYPWTEFRSDHDANGQPTPASTRLIISDDQPHEIMLYLENNNTTSGKAWISDLRLTSPSGHIMPIIGQFDSTLMSTDSAWYNAAYGLVWGGASPVGAGKPLVRGEGAINNAAIQGFWPDLNKDQQGIWLHNNLWAQLGPGGISDLPWWASETIEANQKTGRVPGLLPLYASLQNFLEDIPLSNGHYQDVNARVSNSGLRAWGQADKVNGKIHIWIQNKAHTWRAVVNHTLITPIQGSVVIPEMAAGNYLVQWWDTYNLSNPVIKTQSITVHNGELILDLPGALTTDIAVKIQKLPFFKSAGSS